MAKTLKEKNQMECNKRARQKYDKKTYKYQTLKLKIAEHEELDRFCKENNIPKNSFIKNAIFENMKKFNEQKEK